MQKTTWGRVEKVPHEQLQLLYRPFIEVPYTPPPRVGEKMYMYDNSGRGGYERVGIKRKRTT